MAEAPKETHVDLWMKRTVWAFGILGGSVFTVNLIASITLTLPGYQLTLAISNLVAAFIYYLFLWKFKRDVVSLWWFKPFLLWGMVGAFSALAMDYDRFRANPQAHETLLMCISMITAPLYVGLIFLHAHAQNTVGFGYRLRVIEEALLVITNNLLEKSKREQL